MQLTDPQRPTIAHQPAFIGGMVAIPQPRIWPLADGPFNLVEISMMLPVKETPGVMAKWFTTKMDIEDLPEWVNDFRYDPEKCVLETFTEENGFTPNLSGKSNGETKAGPVSHPKTLDNSLLDDL